MALSEEGCYAQAAWWQICRFRQTLLLAGLTHVSHPPNEALTSDRQYYIPGMM